ncbi:MAG: hypothetical protein A2X50_11850 [Candidatus Rokubacteria bacterium GWF2_70_14]|nr:MAG: hypothetical protein A2X53_19020 [Candidatus Rokubacteria bacterium GWA2_70_23]OGK88825.1 MAG: hypothetical protein A2X50_11850 [Candidatus Rokubacteria bacterium GWF2_70_14]
MGRLTEDMTRLVGEIHAGRDERGRLTRDLKHATAEMKQAVAGMQAGFRSAHADMVRRQQRMLGGFTSGLRGTVAGLRKGFADDLAGAHKVWAGAVPGTMAGRTRRGGKWFAGENA